MTGSIFFFFSFFLSYIYLTALYYLKISCSFFNACSLFLLFIIHCQVGKKSSENVFMIMESSKTRSASRLTSRSMRTLLFKEDAWAGDSRLRMKLNLTGK